MRTAIISQPAELVRAFWNLEQSLGSSDLQVGAVRTFLAELSKGLGDRGTELFFRVGGSPLERCRPYSLYLERTGDRVKVLGVDGHPEYWVIQGQLRLSHESVRFPPGFWQEPYRLEMLLAHHVGLATGTVWQRALTQEHDVPAKWAYLAMVLDDHTSWIGPLSRVNCLISVQRTVNDYLPNALLGIDKGLPLPSMAGKRCEQITKFANALAPLVNRKPLSWDDLRPLEGQGISRRLAFYFTLDDAGPRLSFREAAVILGMDPRSVRRGAKAYKEAVLKKGPKAMRLIIESS